MGTGLEIIVESLEALRLRVKRLRQWLAGDDGLGPADVVRDVDVDRLQIIRPKILQYENKDDSPFIAAGFDPHPDGAVGVSGFVDQGGTSRGKSSAFGPLPTRDELSTALEVSCKAICRLSTDVNRSQGGRWHTYVPPPQPACLEHRHEASSRDGSIDRQLPRGPLLGRHAERARPKSSALVNEVGYSRRVTARESSRRYRAAKRIPAAYGKGLGLELKHVDYPGGRIGSHLARNLQQIFASAGSAGRSDQ
jgi:hypothetical protein